MKTAFAVFTRGACDPTVSCPFQYGFMDFMYLFHHTHASRIHGRPKRGISVSVNPAIAYTSGQRVPEFPCELHRECMLA
jgi:hypothetical protein